MAVTTAESVDESLKALLHKPLCPLVDKAAADTHRRGNVGDGHTVSEK
jgi:hypothetical protein